MKIKIICGYRKDQEYSIPAEEAHKAYFLFAHPNKSAIFSNGLAIKGSQIQTIKPDYVGSMGWNDTHTLDSYDMNEIRTLGVDRKLRNMMSFAKQIAPSCKREQLSANLSDVKKLYLGAGV